MMKMIRRWRQGSVYRRQLIADASAPYRSRPHECVFIVSKILHIKQNIRFLCFLISYCKSNEQTIDTLQTI